MNRVYDNGIGTGKVVFMVVGAIVAVIIISIGAFFIKNEWQRGTANYRGETGQIERTRANADFRIQSYDWFFDQCSAIQAAEGQIEVQEQELDGADEDRAGRIETNLVALRNRRISLITEYNGEAAKEKTSGPFRSADLPAHININNEETECAYAS